MSANLQFHHMGVACRSIEREIRNFTALGYVQESRIYTDAIQKIDCCFMHGPGPRIELIAPNHDESPVWPWVRQGVKYYHQAFETLDLDSAIAQFAAARGKLVSPPVPAAAFDGRDIAFVMLPGLILIELIEANTKRNT